MKRVTFSTTLRQDLLQSARNMAHDQRLRGANDIMEAALILYFKMQEVEVWEKKVAPHSFRRITIKNGAMNLEYIDKRIHISTITDLQQLVSEGYRKL